MTEGGCDARELKSVENKGVSETAVSYLFYYSECNLQRLRKNLSGKIHVQLTEKK